MVTLDEVLRVTVGHIPKRELHRCLSESSLLKHHMRKPLLTKMYTASESAVPFEWPNVVTELLEWDGWFPGECVSWQGWKAAARVEITLWVLFTVSVQRFSPPDYPWLAVVEALQVTMHGSNPNPTFGQYLLTQLISPSHRSTFSSLCPRDRSHLYSAPHPRPHPNSRPWCLGPALQISVLTSQLQISGSTWGPFSWRASLLGKRD